MELSERIHDAGPLVLTEDQLEVVKRCMQKIIETTAFGRDFLTNEEGKDCVFNALGLIEHHYVEICKTVNFESRLAREAEERHKIVRSANQKARELEALLSQNIDFVAVGSIVSKMRDAFNEWFRTLGFSHAYKFDFSPWGSFTVETRPAFETRSFFEYSNPVSLKRSVLELKDEHMSNGLLVHDSDRGETFSIIDVPSNRKYLVDLIRKTFPTANMSMVESHDERRNNTYVISKITLHIKYSEAGALVPFIKKEQPI